MKETNFIELCVKGLAEPGDVDVYVDRWHQGYDGRNKSLSNYLGMTEEEYSQWILNDRVLPKIIDDHRRRIDRDIL